MTPSALPSEIIRFGRYYRAPSESLERFVELFLPCLENFMEYECFPETFKLCLASRTVDFVPLFERSNYFEWFKKHETLRGIASYLKTHQRVMSGVKVNCVDPEAPLTLYDGVHQIVGLALHPKLVWCQILKNGVKLQH